MALLALLIISNGIIPVSIHFKNLYCCCTHCIKNFVQHTFILYTIKSFGWLLSADLFYAPVFFIQLVKKFLFHRIENNVHSKVRNAGNR